MLPHLWQRRFHCTINVCGVPAKLCLWKISSLHYIWCFYLKISFFMEINLQESADWFKLMNEIPNLWGNIILCEKCLFCINFICLITISSQGISPLISDEVQTTLFFRHPISEKKDALDTRLVSWQNINWIPENFQS